MEFAFVCAIGRLQIFCIVKKMISLLTSTNYVKNEFCVSFSGAIKFHGNIF